MKQKKVVKTKRKLVAKVKMKSKKVSLRKFIFEDVKLFTKEFKDVYDAFHTVYMSDAP